MNASAASKVRGVFGRLRRAIRSSSPRERALLVALTAAFIVIAFVVGVKFLAAGLRARSLLSAGKENATNVLKLVPVVDEGLAEKKKQLAGRRLSSAEFLAKIDALTRESGLDADTSQPRVEKTGEIIIYHLRLGLRAPSLSALMNFDDRLRIKGVGFVVESVSVESRGRDGELNANYEIATCQLSE